jgi:hypothetical protein
MSLTAIQHDGYYAKYEIGNPNSNERIKLGLDGKCL